MQAESSAIGKALAAIPSGVAILTAKHDGRANGVLVSWLQQASFDPPAVTICLQHGRPAAGLVEGSEAFMLNIISGDPTAMFKHFGKGFSLEEDAFAGLEVSDTEFGPALRDCTAHLACKLKGKMDAGDHFVYVGIVQAADGGPEPRPYVHLRKNGLSY